MAKLSPNAQLVSDIFDQVAKGNGAPFWEACHDDVVWRTIGTGSWSGEFEQDPGSFEHRKLPVAQA